MSSEIQYVGQHFIVGLAGPALLADEKRLLRELQPLGIILFAKNFTKENSWRETLAALLADVRQFLAREHFFIGIDHEGGRVHRFPAPVTCFPPAATWRARAADVGRAHGRELASLGFNVSMAPVLDIHTEPSNPVIGERALGVTPEEVAEYGCAYFQALEAQGVLACGKHFPGHGATVSDSHKVLPVLDETLETLRTRELRPFEAAIGRGISMLMTAHVRYPRLDAVSPATLSPRILSDLLRGELGYRELLITDDLEMKALDALSPGQKAVQALFAGNDLLLEANPAQRSALEVAEEMARTLCQELSADRFPESVLHSSAARITRALNKLSEVGSRMSPSPMLVGCEEHRHLSASLSSKESDSGTLRG
jgi:beta-N-acetylhexosaminidase